MERGACLLVLLLCVVLGQAVSPVTILSPDDHARLKEVLAPPRPFAKIEIAHSSILGLTLYGVPVPNPQEACAYLKSTVDSSSVPSIYYATTAAKILGNCKVTVNEQILFSAINDSSNAMMLFYAVSALDALDLKYSSADVLKAIDSALKKDDGYSSAICGLHVAALVPGEAHLDKYFDLIEDIVAQADEVDGTYLLYISVFQCSMFLDGAYKLAARLDKKPLITEDQVVMLANCLVIRKSTSSIENTRVMLEGLKALTTNKFHVPVAFTRKSSIAVSSAEPIIKVQVSDLLSGSVGNLTLKIPYIVPKEGGEAVVKDAVFEATKNPIEYQLNLMDSKPPPGFYSIPLRATLATPNPALIGLESNKVSVKVMTEVSVHDMEISIIDKDQAITAKTVQVVYPRKVDKGLEADHHQSVVLKFNLKDKSGKPMAVHQAFVRLSNTKTKQEVIFTADTDASLKYKFTLDVAESGREYFGQQSGKYTLELIIGDALVTNSFSWMMADVTLKFLEQEDTKPSPQPRYSSLPEIKHMFRAPEKRPPKVVSTTFTVLCLVPLLILLILWLKLGANLRGFTFSIGAIGFHLGLASILALFYCYWVYLNMFQTLQYLSILGIFTFLTGNRLLSSIAQKKREK